MVHPHPVSHFFLLKLWCIQAGFGLDTCKIAVASQGADVQISDCRPLREAPCLRTTLKMGMTGNVQRRMGVVGSMGRRRAGVSRWHKYHNMFFRNMANGVASQMQTPLRLTRARVAPPPSQILS